MTDFQKKVFDFVQTVPLGKITTYKTIACAINNPDSARAVGNALNKNKDSNIVPCHRVVNSKGKLAENYAFGGMLEQKKKLIKEGIDIKEDYVNDMTRFLL